MQSLIFHFEHNDKVKTQTRNGISKQYIWNIKRSDAIQILSQRFMIIRYVLHFDREHSEGTCKLTKKEKKDWERKF